MYLSVVIPAFNEAKTIVNHLEMIERFLAQQSYESEVLVVDDGSRDATPELVRQFASTHPRVRLLALTTNRGKGFAVKTGILASTGEIRGFTDADGSTPISEVARFLPAFERGCQVAVASRAKRSTGTKVEAFAHRRLMGRVFNQVLQLMLRLRDEDGRLLADTQCGFKWFSARAAPAIFSRLTIERFAFDVEALYLANRLGFPIAEVPVNWKDYGNSHVNLFADPLKMLAQALSISFRHRNLSP